MAYVCKLMSINHAFDNQVLIDVLLHPAVQYIVKELCLLGAANAPAMEWVEPVVEEWDSQSTREEFGLPDFEPDSMDDISPTPSELRSPLSSDDEWDFEEEEEEESEHDSESEKEAEAEVEESETAVSGDNVESQD